MSPAEDGKESLCCLTVNSVSDYQNVFVVEKLGMLDVRAGSDVFEDGSYANLVLNYYCQVMTVLYIISVIYKWSKNIEN